MKKKSKVAPKKELTPNNMRQELWDLTHDLKSGNVAAKDLNTICTAYKTILATVSEERKVMQLLGKHKTRQPKNLFMLQS